jgi:YD repeat-containing protein
MPVHSYHATPKREGGEAASIHDVEGTTVLLAGGDVQLVYDPYGALVGVFRGQ